MFRVKAPQVSFGDDNKMAANDGHLFIGSLLGGFCASQHDLRRSLWILVTISQHAVAPLVPRALAHGPSLTGK